MVWIWYLAAASVLTVAYLFVPPFKGYAGLINLIGLMSPAAIAPRHTHAPSEGRARLESAVPWPTAYVVGDAIRTRIPALLGGAVGFPSAGDAIYLLVYPALFTGLLLLVRRRNPRGIAPP